MPAVTIAPTRHTREGGVTAPRNHLSAGDVALARRLGTTTKAAQARVERCRDIVRHVAALVARDSALAPWASTLIAPIVHATGVPSVPALTTDLRLTAQEADLEEDLAEARYNADPCREHLMAWRAATSRQVAASRALLAAMGEALAQ